MYLHGEDASFRVCSSMGRWWVVLLLCALWPGTASASIAAPLGWDAAVQVPADDLHEAVHLPCPSEVRQVPASRSGANGTEAPPPGRGLRSTGTAFFGQRRSLLASSSRSPVDPLSPLCERLPYDATAPPLLR